MKSLLTTALAALLLTGAAAQELQMDSTTKKWMYRGVIRNDSLSAGEVFDRARKWVSLFYATPDDRVSYESRDEGQITVDGVWRKSTGGIVSRDAMRHRLTLECKKGRLRYTFSDLVIDHGNVLEYMENTAIKKHRKQYAQMSAQAAGSLEKAMLSGTSDW